MSNRLPKNQLSVICEISELTDKYVVEELKMLCEGVLENLLDFKNASTILIFADKFQVFIFLLIKKCLILFNL